MQWRGGNLDRSDLNRISGAIVDAGIKVHRSTGPGLLESVYEKCLTHELELRGFEVERQVLLPLQYDSMLIEHAFRMDIVVNEAVVVEIKAVSELLPIHRMQLLTYLRLSGLRLVLLMNFNVEMLRDGINRLVNNFPS